MDKDFDNIRKKYLQLWTESKDMIFICNSEYAILDMNPSFRRIFGYKNEDRISFKDIFQDESDFESFNQKVFIKENIDLFEANLITHQGEGIPCIINFFKSVSVDGIETYMGIIKNISKRKRAERKIITTEKLAVTGKIARNIAHEVRNPLTNLNLALDQLKDELGDNQEAELYTEIIERNAERIQTLIGDLLDSSKPRQYNFSQSDINQILNEALGECKDRIVLKNIKLINKISGEKYLREVDKDALKTAFLNLLINAIEAMKNDIGILTVSSEVNGKNIRICIQDNGAGMDEETIEHIFDPFFSRKKDGNGLGLTNVQNIINGHNGHIDVDSQAGQGSTFWIVL